LANIVHNALRRLGSFCQRRAQELALVAYRHGGCHLAAKLPPARPSLHNHKQSKREVIANNNEICNAFTYQGLSR
jgi:hypothetical protein